MSSRFFALCLGLLVFLVLLAWSSMLYVLWRLRIPPPPAAHAVFQMPGIDAPPASAPLARERETVAIGAGFARWGPNPPELPGSWPTFLGPRYDGISREAVRLADRWPESGPRELWSVDLGEGYSVILMSVHPNAPYRDRFEDDATTLIYEGHDAPRNRELPDPKGVHHGLLRALPPSSGTKLKRRAARGFAQVGLKNHRGQ